MRTAKILLAGTLALGLATPAVAAQLATPTLFKGGTNSQNVCVATNVGTNPVTVTVRMVAFTTGASDETCTIQPGDPSGCQNFANDLAYCQVLVQGSAKNVRAVMMNRDIVSPFTIHAAVDAR